MSVAVLCTTRRCPRVYCCTVHQWTFYTCLLLHHVLPWTLSRVCCCTMHYWTFYTCLLLHCAPLDVLHVFYTCLLLYCAPLDVAHVSVVVLCNTGRCPRVYCYTMYHPGRCHVSTAVPCTTLYVADGPVFATRPGNVTVEAGENVTLPCHVTGYPPPVLQWITPKSGETATRLCLNS